MRAFLGNRKKKRRENESWKETSEKLEVRTRKQSWVGQDCFAAARASDVSLFVPDNNHTTQENTGGVWFFIAATPKHGGVWFFIAATPKHQIVVSNHTKNRDD